MTDPSGGGYVAAFSLALKGVETIKNMVTTADAKKQASELFEIILSGQRSALEESVKQRALLETVRELEAKLTELETWNVEKQRYALVNPWAGSVVYALKQSASGGEPPHYICPNCYTDGKKSILNVTANSDGQLLLVCRCKVQIRTQNRARVVMQYAESVQAPT